MATINIKCQRCGNMESRIVNKKQSAIGKEYGECTKCHYVAIALLCPGAAISYDVTGFIIERAVKKFGWKYGYQVLKGTLPVVRGVFSKFYTAIRKVIGKVVKGLITKVGSSVIELLIRSLTRIASKGKWNTKEVYYSIAMFFSFGSFIAGLLDFISDGIINGNIKT